jgi:hypothetical protein
MTAKEFIIQNSPKFSEAVENGYDIRMDEDEILDFMQRFRDAAPKSVQLCPKCLGEAFIPNIPLGMHTSSFRQCPVCNGSRIFII